MSATRGLRRPATATPRAHPSETQAPPYTRAWAGRDRWASPCQTGPMRREPHCEPSSSSDTLSLSPSTRPGQAATLRHSSATWLAGRPRHTAQHRGGPCFPKRSHTFFCEGTGTASVCAPVQLSLCQGHQASPSFDARSPTRSPSQLPPDPGRWAPVGSGAGGETQHQLRSRVLLGARGHGHFPWGWTPGHSGVTGLPPEARCIAAPTPEPSLPGACATQAANGAGQATRLVS